MKIAITTLLLCLNFLIQAQELVKTDWEQGYVKDGMRYSVWQYFNSKKEPELVINHSTGKVMFISKDTTDYVIYKESQWIKSKLDIHPVPIEGTHNFNDKLRRCINYSDSLYSKRKEGKAIVLFEVDTLGNSINFKIAQHFSDQVDSVLMTCLKSIDQTWIPARIGKKKYVSKFSLKIDFRLKDENPTSDSWTIEDSAKDLEEEIVVTHVFSKIFTFVEQKPEFPGGQGAYGEWLAQRLKFPPSAKRIGLEGKVFVKFIVEPDGSITNAEIVKGFDRACEREAIRVVTSMPKWKPGMQGGRAVRTYQTQVIGFISHN